MDSPILFCPLARISLLLWFVAAITLPLKTYHHARI